MSFDLSDVSLWVTAVLFWVVLCGTALVFEAGSDGGEILGLFQRVVQLQEGAAMGCLEEVRRWMSCLGGTVPLEGRNDGSGERGGISDALRNLRHTHTDFHLGFA